jgi:hypothetical protein
MRVRRSMKAGSAAGPAVVAPAPAAAAPPAPAAVPVPVALPSVEFEDEAEDDESLVTVTAPKVWGGPWLGELSFVS